MQNLCPCGSNKSYENCCKQYISGNKKPKTAELLMRSRYSAYVFQEIDYIINTTNPNNRNDYSYEDIENWSKSSKWKKLIILNTEKGTESDITGIVEFQAFYEINGISQIHHEKSVFDKIDNVWYYTTQLPVSPIKINRNSPCPCGSGKKYKKCCGK
ncbi:MAG: motif domain protein [Fusobacteriales bacterium]|jgi:SEC-C motif-containing protein|nr:motif domain protein [Fusobacteriales bacterium]